MSKDQWIKKNSSLIAFYLEQKGYVVNEIKDILTPILSKIVPTLKGWEGMDIIENRDRSALLKLVEFFVERERGISIFQMTGAKIKSAKKAKASRNNGKLGGRPKKSTGVKAVGAASK